MGFLISIILGTPLLIKQGEGTWPQSELQLGRTKIYQDKELKISSLVMVTMNLNI